MTRIKINSARIKSFLIVVTLFFSLNIVVSYLYHHYSKTLMMNEFIQTADKSVDSMYESLETKFSEIDKMTNYLILSYGVQNFIAYGNTDTATGDSAVTITDQINAYKFTCDYIDSIYVYSENTNKIFTNNGIINCDVFSDMSWKAIYDKCELTAVGERKINNVFPPVFSFVRKINKGDINGGVILNVKISELDKVLGETSDDTSKKYIVNSDGIILYERNIKNFENNIDALNISYKENKVDIISGKEKTSAVAVKKSEKYDFTYIVENELYDYEKQIDGLMLYTIFFAVILMIISLIVCWLYSDFTYRPLRELVKLVTKPDEYKTLKFSEIETEYVASRIFAEMSKNEKLKNELISKMDYIEKLKLYNLRVQINPHFINNTLNLVHMKLITNIGLNYPCSKIVENFGRLLQYIVRDNSDLVTLESEIETSKLFAQILSERSDGKIGFEIIKDEMVSNQALVPKLCFNTLIENAFYHGINPKPDQRGMVKINITKKDDKLICSVTDDGIGMSKEEILSIKEQIDKFDEMPLKCIGLANIKFRIELLFGRNGTFDILSEKGMGTTIYVSIPYEEKE